MAAAECGVGSDRADLRAARAQGERLGGRCRAGERAQRPGAGARALQRGGRDEAEHPGPTARGCGIEVGRAPDTPVDVLAAADPDGREDPRDRARGHHRLADPGGRRAGRAEHHPPAAAPVDGGDPQPPVEARAQRVEVPAEPGERARRGGRRGQRGRPQQAAGRRRAGERDGRQRRRPRRRRRDRHRAPPRASSPGRCGRLRVARPRPGRRDRRPPAAARPARPAATIEPADVPTKYSQPRMSGPPAASRPLRSPRNQASPSVPPTPRTSTSGRSTSGSAMPST